MGSAWLTWGGFDLVLEGPADDGVEWFWLGWDRLVPVELYLVSLGFSDNG